MSSSGGWAPLVLMRTRSRSRSGRARRGSSRSKSRLYRSAFRQRQRTHRAAHRRPRGSRRRRGGWYRGRCGVTRRTLDLGLVEDLGEVALPFAVILVAPALGGGLVHRKGQFERGKILLLAA